MKLPATSPASTPSARRQRPDPPLDRLGWGWWVWPVSQGEALRIRWAIKWDFCVLTVYFLIISIRLSGLQYIEHLHPVAAGIHNV